MPILDFTPNTTSILSIEKQITLEAAPEYTLPGLALFAPNVTDRAIAPAERFTTVDALDQGIFTTYTISTLAADVAGVYIASGGVTTKLEATAYTLDDTLLILQVGLSVGQVAYVVSVDSASLTFIGSSGLTRIEQTALYLRRSSNYTYGDIKIFSENMNITQTTVTKTNCTASIQGGFVRITGFTGLTSDSLIGQAVLFNNAYVGKVVTNTPTYLVLDTSNFESLIEGTATVFTIGTLEFAVETAGVIGTFTPVLSIPLVDTEFPVFKIWVKEALQLPAFSTVFANMNIKITAIEYR